MGVMSESSVTVEATKDQHREKMMYVWKEVGKLQYLAILVFTRK